MGIFSKKGKNSYGEYANDLFEDDYTLSDEGILPIGQRQDVNFSTRALTPDEVKGSEPDTPSENIPMKSAGESLYKRMAERNNAQSADSNTKSEEVKKQAESLLARCSQYVSDDKNSSTATSKPIYTLDSVEDIIAEVEKRAQDRVKKIYGGDTVEETIKEEPRQEVKPDEVKKEDTTADDENLARTKEIVLPPEVIGGIQDSIDATIEMPKVTPDTITMSRNSDNKRSYQFRFADEDRESAPLDGSGEEEASGNTISFKPVKETPTSLADEVRASLEMVDISSGKKEELTDAEEELFGDYESIEDAAETRKTLKKKHNALRLRSTLTLVAAVIITVLALPFLSATRDVHGYLFLLLEVILTAFAAIVNCDVFKSLTTLLGKKSNADLPLALCTIATLIFGIFCAATQTIVPQYGVIAVVGMLFSVHYKRRTAKRIIKNFETIATSDEKFAVTLINEENGSYAIAHDAVDGEALVAAGKKTVNIHHFLKNSYADDAFTPITTILAIIGLALSTFLFAYGAIASSLLTGFSLLIAMLSVCAPFSGSLVGHLPLYLASLRLSKYDAMLAGHTAAEEIEQTNAVVFDIGSIFPRGTVKMYDMKVLSPNNLERTIFNAAAVTTSINSPLGHVFRRIARTSEEYVLPPADSVKYENRLGISGWVGDFSVLIGNRTLMETHGVPVPSVEVDKKILRNGYFPVYVASNGQPCALLIVGYEGNDDITGELHRLCAAGVTVLINNCDPNVTENMLCDYFGLPEGFVKLMQSGSIRKYQECTEFSESCVAGAAYSGSACGLAGAVASAIKVKKLTLVMTILHIILLFAGIAGAVVLTLTGQADKISPLFVLAYLLLGAILVRISALFIKP